jgi:nucleoside-diphosphate-sugar epimerase
MKNNKSKTEQLSNILVEDALLLSSKLDFKLLENKSIMITGANGLIGMNFLASLYILKKKLPGITVFPVFHNEPPAFLLPFLEMNDIYPLIGDLTNENFIKKLPRIDFVIHAAGSGEPTKFIKNSISTLKVNTITTIKLLEKLQENGRFLFLSSSDIYNGLQSGLLYSENQIGTTNTDHPRACYIEGKRTGETICDLFREKGIATFAIRLSLTYGPGLRIDDQRVLPSFIKQGLNGKIELLDKGNVERTFCYVTDAIELMWFVLLFGTKRVYNVGSISHIKIIELAELIGKILNVTVCIPNAYNGIAGAPLSNRLDLSRIFTEYQKNDFIELAEGLKKTINWYRCL